jgi:RNA polymerase sigma-70 factor (ECF subfamily)
MTDPAPGRTQDVPLTTPRRSHNHHQRPPRIGPDEPAPAPTAVLPSDLDLLLRSRSHPDTFGLLFERYWPPIFAYCLRRLQSPDVADDAAATVFAKAFAARNRFQPARTTGGGSVRSWLFSIAHNVVVDVWRHDPLPLSMDREDITALHGLADQGAALEDAAIGAEEARAVMTILDHLPERQRSAVELRLAGLTTPEVADVLGLSLSATKSLQFRAYRALRDLIRTNPHLLSRELPA